MYKNAYLEIVILGKDKERFLNLCAFHNILLWDIKMKEESYIIRMNAADLFLVRRIVKKTDIKLKIVKRKGIYFKLKTMKYQKIFFFCLLCGFFLLWLSSHFLWKIEIRGNLYLSNLLVESFLKEEGISYGMPLRRIATEELEKKIRKKFFEITWTSISIDGTSLVIQIKENDALKIQEENQQPSNITAGKTGVVKDIFVRQGTALVKPGDMVQKGDILIRGEVEIPAEDGSVKEIVSTSAKGDITMEYEIPIKEKLLLEYDTKVYTGMEKRDYEFQLKEKIIGRKRKSSPFFLFDTIKEEITPSIVKKFIPSFSVYKMTYRDYFLQKEKYSLEEGEKILNKKFNKIIKSLEEKGVQIIEKNVKIRTNSVSLQLEGTLKVEEVFKEKNNRNE